MQPINPSVTAKDKGNEPASNMSCGLELHEELSVSSIHMSSKLPKDQIHVKLKDVLNAAAMNEEAEYSKEITQPLFNATKPEEVADREDTPELLDIQSPIFQNVKSELPLMQEKVSEFNPLLNESSNSQKENLSKSQKIDRKALDLLSNNHGAI